MARLILELPEQFTFTTEIPVLIGHINYGGHVGNDAILSLIHEARFRYLKQLGYCSELDIEGLGMIMTDTAIIYKAEAFHGETMLVQVTPQDFNKYGCDFIFKLTNQQTGKEIARAKTGIVFFDYLQRKVVEIPTEFRKKSQSNV
ncbi:acyl-CoA thioesterase [Beggiatoa leptomitoformis]|uniref:Thioesterase n=1 Tax=Beggiatoa leptomitoformis TaxID=288004 RepID=A0A2N9YHC0_9GAMM|nr:thioesterase family protein [Beggiatoa leptomitoformis]ALG67842.1 thioesterase [Beggiatoa leptomitoformis]AUI69900.1 thioesterase [Beggiatoa leptomitoformis]